MSDFNSNNNNHQNDQDLNDQELNGNSLGDLDDINIDDIDIDEISLDSIDLEEETPIENEVQPDTESANEDFELDLDDDIDLLILGRDPRFGSLDTLHLQYMPANHLHEGFHSYPQTAGFFIVYRDIGQ